MLQPGGGCIAGMRAPVSSRACKMLAGAHTGGAGSLSGCLSKQNCFAPGFQMVMGKGRFGGCVWAGCACLCRSGQLCLDAEGCSRCFGRVAKSFESSPKRSQGSGSSPLLRSILPAATTIHPEQLYPALRLGRNYSPINPGSSLSLPPAASEGNKSAAVQILKCCSWGD